PAPRISISGRQRSAGSASLSEAMTVAVGLSPRGGNATTGRRGATLEGLDWLFGSGVAPRRAPFAQHYSVGSSPRHHAVAPLPPKKWDTPCLHRAHPPGLTG